MSFYTVRRSFMRFAVGVAVVAVLALAVSAQAGPPVNGVYKSDLGQMLEGRFSECWVGGGQGQLGNTVHGQSWDGTLLGTNWEVACPYIQMPPQLISDNVDGNGNGTRTYRTRYFGGTFRLSGTGAWAGGDAFYGGDLDSYVHNTTFTIVNWVPQSYVTNVQLYGYIDGYTQCMQISIANAMSEGYGPQQADFPVYLNGPAACAPATGLIGEYGHVHCITLVILHCETGADNTSWGAVKSLYR
jgi:hypothetical protein